MKSNQFLIITLLLFSILLHSCKKGTESNDGIVLPDKILYTDIIPDTVFTSVRYWSNTGGFGILPVPSDSSAGMYIDVDHDSIPDLGLFVYTYYQMVSASHPEANYNFGCIIKGNDSRDSIIFDSITGPCHNAKPFLKDSVISGGFKFDDYTYLYSSGFSTPCHIAPVSGDAYYGFKILINGKFCYGWIRVNFDSMNLTLKEFAVNLTGNNSIKAGQKE